MSRSVDTIWDVADPAFPHPYHHGDLRRALIEAAEQTIRESGPTSLSVRDVARRVGVSHAAPSHHFGDKTGLLTAMAAEGYRRMDARLREAYARSGSFLEVGVAYVRFAIDERPYFEVMFRPDLYRRDDPEVAVALSKVDDTVFGAIRTMLGPGAEDRVQPAGVAAWSLVHGLATLILNGNLPAAVAADSDALTRSVGAAFFRGARSGSDAAPADRAK
jgi:AcrR family transcriptional regulator